MPLVSANPHPGNRVERIATGSGNSTRKPRESQLGVYQDGASSPNWPANPVPLLGYVRKWAGTPKWSVPFFWYVRKWAGTPKWSVPFFWYVRKWGGNPQNGVSSSSSFSSPRNTPQERGTLKEERPSCQFFKLSVGQFNTRFSP